MADIVYLVEMLYIPEYIAACKTVLAMPPYVTCSRAATSTVTSPVTSTVTSVVTSVVGCFAIVSDHLTTYL
jgi:hypothetical protein